MKTYSANFQGYWREQNKNGIPSKSGVYLVYRCIYDSIKNVVGLKEIIYVGQAKNVHDRLLNHEKQEMFNSKLLPNEELCYSFAQLPAEDLDAVEYSIIFAQKPVLNDAGKDKYDFPAAYFKFDGNCAGLRYTDYKIA